MKVLRSLLVWSWCLFLSVQAAWAQADSEGSLVHWMTLEEAMQKEQTAPRPIIMDFYTDWCGWCKHMMRTTYADPGLAQYINANFYPVKFDAEGKDTIEYLGKTYKPTSPEPRRPHEFAMEMLQGRLSYPTTVFLNGYDKSANKFNVSMNAAGYLEVRKLEPILIYLVENASRNSTFDDFNRGYERAFFDSTNFERMKQLTWTDSRTFFARDAVSKKKTMVMIDSDWCNACKVMRRTTFTDSTVVDYLKKTFDLVELDATLADTLYLNGTLFAGLYQQFPFSQLSMALCRNNLVLPMLVVMDENRQIVDAIPSYITPTFMNDIMHFYGDDHYKKESWQDYVKAVHSSVK